MFVHAFILSNSRLICNVYNGPGTVLGDGDYVFKILILYSQILIVWLNTGWINKNAFDEPPVDA